LATAAAAPGVTLTLLGRSKERLEAVAAAARAKGATVSTEVVDVRDKEAVAGALWRVSGCGGLGGWVGCGSWVLWGQNAV
jgi:NADP-dependent 3-hydroxy acid dehydrogenase YdfG